MFLKNQKLNYKYLHIPEIHNIEGNAIEYLAIGGIEWKQQKRKQGTWNFIPGHDKEATIQILCMPSILGLKSGDILEGISFRLAPNCTHPLL